MMPDHAHIMTDVAPLRSDAGADAALNSMRPIPRIAVQAFCETDEIAGPVERAGEDRRMAKTHVTVHRGEIDKAIEFFQSAPTPNLIIVESSREPRDMLSVLGGLAEVCDPTTKVVVIGHYNDVWLYRELKKAGVSEYLVAPVSLGDVIAVAASIFIDPDSEPLGRTVAFIGAKGGVGSSTIAHNVSWTMSSLFQSEVVIADLDLAFGTANINFDQDPPQGMAEAVFSPERVDEVYLDRLLAQCAQHLSLLAAPSTLERVYDFDDNAFVQVIETAQRTSPMVILDLPHVWTGWTKSTLAQADEVVITVTPELANLRNAKNLIDTLRKIRPNDTSPHLIINQTGVPKRPEISVEDFSEPLELTPLAVIPFDPQLFGIAANNGRMLGETDAQSPIVQIMSDVAHVLTGRMETGPKKKAGIGRLLNSLRLKK